MIFVGPIMRGRDDVSIHWCDKRDPADGGGWRIATLPKSVFESVVGAAVEAPDGAVIDGYRRVGGCWVRLEHDPGCVCEPDVRSRGLHEASCPHACFCAECDGCGWVEGGATLSTTCTRCEGTGQVREERKS